MVNPVRNSIILHSCLDLLFRPCFKCILFEIQVRDRTVIKTTTDETKATSPPELQATIDELVAKYKSSRSFVR